MWHRLIGGDLVAPGNYQERMRLKAPIILRRLPGGSELAVKFVIYRFCLLAVVRDFMPRAIVERLSFANFDWQYRA
jgi:hypothetical protein